jgi:S-adenosylmethionine decarboxylase
VSVFITHDCKGIHILADFWGIEQSLLLSEHKIGYVLEQAALAGKAKILSTQLHCFGIEQGVTGVALLAESHLSIHTWPAQQLAAIDIYMCGATDADRALLSLKENLQPTQVSIHRLERGVRPSSGVTQYQRDSNPHAVAEPILNVR